VKRLQVPNCCHEISNPDPSLDWRNWLVKKYVGAEAERGQRVTLLPFSDITKGAPDMHTCHPMYKHDCTHYCYWPTLWQPFWTMLQRMTATLKVTDTWAARHRVMRLLRPSTLLHLPIFLPLSTIFGIASPRL
jgi:hypothetical protein